MLLGIIELVYGVYAYVREGGTRLELFHCSPTYVRTARGEKWLKIVRQGSEIHRGFRAEENVSHESTEIEEEEGEKERDEEESKNEDEKKIDFKKDKKDTLFFILVS